MWRTVVCSGRFNLSKFVLVQTRKIAHTLMAETSTADNPGVSAMHFEQLEPFSSRGKVKVQREHFVTITGVFRRRYELC